MNIFLDDVRMPKDVTWVKLPLGEWQIVRSFDTFCAAVHAHLEKYKCLPGLISYDHDLSDYDAQSARNQDHVFKEKTGMDCAKWLVNLHMGLHELRGLDGLDKKLLWFPWYIVHSMNPIGRQNIESYLDSYCKSLGLPVPERKPLFKMIDGVYAREEFGQ